MWNGNKVVNQILLLESIDLQALQLQHKGRSEKGSQLEICSFGNTEFRAVFKILLKSSTEKDFVTLYFRIKEESIMIDEFIDDD